MKISPYYDKIKTRAIELLRSGVDGETFENLRLADYWKRDDYVGTALHLAVEEVARSLTLAHKHEYQPLKYTPEEERMDAYEKYMELSELHFTESNHRKARDEIARLIRDQ